MIGEYRTARYGAENISGCAGFALPVEAAIFTAACSSSVTGGRQISVLQA
jgi:hypothetical protein